MRRLILALSFSLGALLLCTSCGEDVEELRPTKPPVTVHTPTLVPGPIGIPEY